MKKRKVPREPLLGVVSPSQIGLFNAAATDFWDQMLNIDDAIHAVRIRPEIFRNAGKKAVLAGDDSFPIGSVDVRFCRHASRLYLFGVDLKRVAAMAALGAKR